MQSGSSPTLSASNPHGGGQITSRSSLSKVSRRDRERVRVSRACDRCKKKKARCTGKHPCALCVRSGQTCEFNAAYTRGRVPPIIIDELQIPGYSNDANTSEGVQSPEEMAFEDDTPFPSPVSNEARVDSSGSCNQARVIRMAAIEEFPAISSRNSPEPHQTDLQGHYVGPSSGVAFLLRAQKKLQEAANSSTNSSIFTFGDSPLPEYNPSFFVLPSRDEARKLCARYFDFAFPTHRFLHQQTVERWLEQFYDNVLDSKPKRGVREKNAVVLMVFAQAIAYMPGEAGKEGLDLSVRYFAAVEQQLAAETGETRLTSIQARLCQCFYLLSQSRINHCWSLFGTTAHLALAIGLHRRRWRDGWSGSKVIEAECRKRVFWCAYSLDNYLSVALGRPRTFHDDDIDQDLPSCVNDLDLTSKGDISMPTKTQSVMLAPVYHAKLSKIISGILKDLYGIQRINSALRIAHTRKHAAELSQWRQGISHFLEVGPREASLMIPLFQRQNTVLNLAYRHALILLYRPFLLTNFATLAEPDSERSIDAQISAQKSTVDCVDAALGITSLINDLWLEKQIYRAFWFTHYYAFCAIVVLYVHSIQRRSDPPQTWRRSFEAAEKCQKQLSSFVEKSSFAQRYGIVLEELRLEAVRQTQRNHTIQGPEKTDAVLQVKKVHVREPPKSMKNLTVEQIGDDASFLNSMSSNLITEEEGNTQGLNTLRNDLSINGSVNAAFNELQFQVPEIGGDPQLTPLTAEMFGWGDLDSLVTAGIGDFEALFSTDFETFDVAAATNSQMWAPISVNTTQTATTALDS